MIENKKKLIFIISDELKIPENKINMQSSANDFPEWDSLSNIRLILRISKEKTTARRTSKNNTHSTNPLLQEKSGHLFQYIN